MTRKKILILSTYPIKNPQHGGQKRLDAIYKIYKENFEDVKHSAVFFRGFYSDFDEDDIPLGSEGEKLVMKSPLTGDIISGNAIYSDSKVKHKIVKLLTDFKPDIIHIEQPYAYLGLNPLLKELKIKPKLIFGSQNIEGPMKREILEGAHLGEKDIAEAENTINELENRLTSDSDLVVACTREDLAFYEKMNARRSVLAPNGIGEIQTTPRAKQYWKNQFSKIGVAKKALFVGSAHPPNWTGFLKMLGKGLGYIPFDTRIVIAGSVCDYFTREISENSFNIEDATFWLRAFAAGRLSEAKLGALIEDCDLILLPITDGGGSNLKTAEAILANKKVVATKHALRSFEWFIDFPNVWIADNQEEFQSAITNALKSPLIERTPDQTQKTKQVTWESCLANLVKEVSIL